MDNFLPWEVLPCAPQNRDAIYELGPDGEAYDNVYALRKVRSIFAQRLIWGVLAVGVGVP